MADLVFLKKYNVITKIRLFWIVLELNICLIIYNYSHYRYLREFERISIKDIVHIQINEIEYKETDTVKFLFINELKRGNYYFRIHRVQKIEKDWDVKIQTNTNKFNLIIEKTYKYGFTVYLLKGKNEICYYRNNNLQNILDTIQ